MNVICLVVDHLHKSYLGAFGNTWIRTPHFDELAFESFLFDQCLAESPRQADFYRALFQGRHPLQPRQEKAPSLVGLLLDQGTPTLCVTNDDAISGDDALVGGCDEVISVPLSNPGHSVENIDQSQLAAFFAALCDTVDNLPGDAFVWAHCSGLGTCWDAPRALREEYLEAEEEEVFSGCELPQQPLPPDFDPDELLAVRRAYAAQVTLWDSCLQMLLEVVRGSTNPPLLVVLSPRGLSLGEHRLLGTEPAPLYAENIHVPALIRFPEGTGAGCRSQALTQPADWFRTLGELYGLDAGREHPCSRSLLPIVRSEQASLRDRAVVAGDGPERGLRTPAWFARMPHFSARSEAEIDPHAEEVELFVKPDDLWECNNVADRCPQVVAGMLHTLLNWEDCAARGDWASVAELDESLTTGFE